MCFCVCRGFCLYLPFVAVNRAVDDKELTMRGGDQSKGVVIVCRLRNLNYDISVAELSGGVSSSVLNT